MRAPRRSVTCARHSMVASLGPDTAGRPLTLPCSRPHSPASRPCIAAKCATSTPSTISTCSSSPPIDSRRSTWCCPDPIPGRARVLQAISLFWFARTASLVPNHLTGRSLASVVTDPAQCAALEGRAMIVRPPEGAADRSGRAWLSRRLGMARLSENRSHLRHCAAGRTVSRHRRSLRPSSRRRPKRRWGRTNENIGFEAVVESIGPTLAAQVPRHRAGSLSAGVRARSGARHHHRRHQV